MEKFRFIKIIQWRSLSSVGFQMLEGLQTGQTLRGDYLQKKNYPIHGYQLKLPGPKK
jgi:hypothetical protein